MSRSQLVFVVLLNAIVSLAVALAVAWVVDARRPDLEELAALYTPVPAGGAQPIIAPTATAAVNAIAPVVDTISTPTLLPTAAPEGEKVIHVVQSGESLDVIARKYNVLQDAIVTANNIEDPNKIFVGQRLVVPGITPADVPIAAPATDTPTANGAGLVVRSVISPGDLVNEAVELVNDSNQQYALQGWKLQRENGAEYTFDNLPIFPGGSIKLFSGPGSDNTIARYWNQAEAVWQSGTVVRLLDPQGNVITTYQVP